MVRALIDVDENTNRVLNVVKARHGFKDKSQAISFIISRYIDDEAEPELRSDFIEKMNRIMRQKSIAVGNVSNLRKRYEK